MIFNIIFKYNLKFDIKKLTFMNLVNKDIYVLLPDKGLSKHSFLLGKANL